MTDKLSQSSPVNKSVTPFFSFKTSKLADFMLAYASQVPKTRMVPSLFPVALIFLISTNFASF